MTAASPRRHRVLIVEDEAITALDLATELTGMGYDVCGVVEGADEAVAAAIRERPALILMDIRLAHGGDGIATALDIQRQHDAAIVFLTAHSDEATIARALKASPFGYLIKPFRGRDLRVAIELAASKHLKDTTATRKLETLAATDAVTGLSNRRRIDAVIEQEWARCSRNRQPLAILLIDIDHFKAYNDRYGHLAGDEALRTVAAAISTVCQRPGDVVGRWGGEEFLAVLPATDSAGAMQVATAAVEAVRAAGIPHEHSPTGKVVTVSAGVAVAIPKAPMTAFDLVDKADQSLYAAKHAGRCRACDVGSNNEG